jgi:hypothetical protein
MKYIPLIVAGFLVVGCGKTEVSAPGVNVKVGPGGVQVKAPNVDVNTGAGGAKVDVGEKK